MRTRFFIVPAVIALCGALSFDSGAALSRTSYVGGSFLLNIEGQPGGYVPAIAGGAMSSTVVVDRSGNTGSFPKKHAGAVQYDDISFAVSLPEKPLAEWMKTTLASAAPVRKSGSFSSLDFNFKEVSKTTWTSGFISDITFPELDATSKDPARINVTITPSSTSVNVAGSGKVESAASGLKSKQALSSNYRLTIPGVDTSKVSHIDPLSVRFKAVSPGLGERREYEKTVGDVDVSNLAFVLAEHSADSVYKWHQDFVVKGNNSDAQEKTATLELLGPDMKSVLWKITMKGVGILKVSADPTSSESLRKVRAEAYVESIVIDQL
jgi:hypothetical protein